MLRSMFSCADERRRVREHGAAGRVIEMAVAVDDVAHGRPGKRVSSSPFSHGANVSLIGSPRMMPAGVTRNTVYQLPLRAR